MATNIETPSMGESISEATVATWSKKEGDFVEQDELIAELETEKVNLEVTAPSAGKLTKINAGEGATVSPGDILGEIDESATGGDAAPAPAAEAAEEAPATEVAAAPAPTAQAAPADTSASAELSPAVRKLIDETGINPAEIAGTGKGGRITKEDVIKYMEQKAAAALQGGVSAPAPTAAPAQPAAARETREKMSRLRKTVARNLKTAQNNAALLTTYNEVDMQEIFNLRKEYKDTFLEKHGVKLGFMSFFTKAVTEALKEFPAINAEIDMENEEVIYKNYYNIGIAVSTPRGLMVPVVRDADQMGFAEIETTIKGFGEKGRDGKISMDDMAGGSFTITNGGVFGSMMSMPIVNYPQVAILGMHNIVERPVAVNGEVVIRPIMYVALTYDHRIVDGRESVSFLRTVKESLENPTRLMLSV